MNTSTTTTGNIILVGFMGSGKSSVAKEVSRVLGFQLADLDQLIKTKAGKSIPVIFSEGGEELFRKYEAEVLKEVAETQTDPLVIATGGGIVLKESNRELLKSLGFVTWLKASAEETFKRVGENSDRPLLNGDDPFTTINTLIAERSPLYQEVAHFEVDTNDLSVFEIACGIIDSASVHFAQNVNADLDGKAPIS